MLAHVVLIITSGLSGLMAPDALDRAIKQLLFLKKTPILVLGADGDEVMRTCMMFESAEMVFDPNGAGPFSPIKAGLHATDASAYVWHADQKFPSNEQWARLDEALRLLDDSSVEALQTAGVPITLLTRNGVKKMRELPADSAWPVSGLKIKSI